MPHPTPTRHHSFAATLLWACVMGLGLFGLDSYSLIAGPRGVAPAQWPAELGPLEPGLNLVVYAHPHCPCTRATLWEAAELVAAAKGQLTSQVLFYTPLDQPESWVQGDLWDIAAETPHTTPRIDLDGHWAEAHGAKTSGHCRVYDASGALVFDGGLTASRGHQGLSVGKDAVRALLQNHQPSETTTPVYGCGISQDTCAP